MQLTHEPIKVLEIETQAKKHSLPKANFNQKTLESYSINAKAYRDATPQLMHTHQPEMLEWIDMTLKVTPQSGTIFEIGSATLRDATYMRSQGFNVICSDAAAGFVELLRKEGEDAREFNLLEDSFSEKHSTIFANGVFPHFNAAELSLALDTISEGLVENGVLAFSIKCGQGDEWLTEKFNSKRFTHYWLKESLSQLLDLKNFEIIFENSNKGPHPSQNWLNLVCRKI